MKSLSVTERHDLVAQIVRVWAGGLSPGGSAAISSYDLDDLAYKISALLDVVIARRGAIPGVVHSISERAATIQQNLSPSVVEGLRLLGQQVGEPEAAAIFEQSSTEVVSALLYQAANRLEILESRVADLEGTK